MSVWLINKTSFCAWMMDNLRVYSALKYAAMTCHKNIFFPDIMQYHFQSSTAWFAFRFVRHLFKAAKMCGKFDWPMAHSEVVSKSSFHRWKSSKISQVTHFSLRFSCRVVFCFQSWFNYSALHRSKSSKISQVSQVSHFSLRFSCRVVFCF
jgi:hypothetical protein